MMWRWRCVDVVAGSMAGEELALRGRVRCWRLAREMELFGPGLGVGMRRTANHGACGRPVMTTTT